MDYVWSYLPRPRLITAIREGRGPMNGIVRPLPDGPQLRPHRWMIAGELFIVLAQASDNSCFLVVDKTMTKKLISNYDKLRYTREFEFTG